MPSHHKHPPSSFPSAQAARTTTQSSPSRTGKPNNNLTSSHRNTGNLISEKTTNQSTSELQNSPSAFVSGVPGKLKTRKESDISSIRSSSGTTKGDTSLRKMWFPIFNFKKSREGVTPKPQVLAQTSPNATPQNTGTGLKETDIVIALMGPTGSGKSSFISTVAGVDRGVGHGLESCTSKIETIPVRIPTTDGVVEAILVDTPGFDDTHKSDYEILQLISNWLKDAGDKKVLLDGILYLHRISDNRMAGTPLRNLSVFKKLCGPQAYGRVIMVTTMWDELDSEEMGYRREEELKSEFWAPMIKRGSATKRYKNTRDSAYDILQRFIVTPVTKSEATQPPEETSLPKEMVGHAGAPPIAGVEVGGETMARERPVVLRPSKETVERKVELPDTKVSQESVTEERLRPRNIDAGKGTTPKKQPAPIQLQKEMVKYNRALPNTDAGQELLAKIDELDKRRKKLMRTLKKQMNKPGTDADIVKLLQDQYQGLEKEHQAALQELGNLKVSAPQRIQKALGIKAKV